MLIYAINLIYLLFFLVVYLQDRRRLINGFLFFILLMLSGVSLVLLVDETGNPFLFFLVVIIGIMATLILLTGVFIILAISFYSAVTLLRKEGRSKANLLSLLVGVGILLWLFLGMVTFKNVEINDVLSVVMLLVNTILLYLLVMFSNFILSSFIYGIYRPLLRQDYIIVLGSGLVDGRTVTPLLAGRIDRALKVYRRQADKRKKPPMLIMSGGKGGDEQVAEGDAMKQYALEQGIPEDHVLVEDQSKNTFENMLFSRQLIQSREPDMKHLRILFATSNYHVFRAGIYARKAHLKAQGIGAKTKFYFWYNALLREYVAILAMHKKTHLVCIFILVVIVGLVSLLIHNPEAASWLAGKIA
ncbi:YdcF family protein [Eubacterium sp. 1001713B170207_170306_E7]|uniref:YdcF family protein n=1 Tax=Eubacterium sp. 1001713B170207_170306_E7 TaxID=2787097 RepID=UPI001898A2FD|nr:YdcF family protein [Eubacterium sp. 1001713B170207_170306_E7]